MSDETPAEQTPDVPPPAPAPARAGEAITDGGYAYTILDETPDAKTEPTSELERESRPLRIAWPLMVTLIVVPAIAIGLAAWFTGRMTADDSGGDSARAGANVSSVLDVFGSAQGGQSLRLEGEAPAGLPDDLPVYPGAEVLSSLVQANGADAVYLVVYDTTGSLDDVSSYFAEALNTDPWQIDLGQASSDSAAVQFTKIDDADIEGQVLLGTSADAGVTTIFMIVQIIGGAEDVDFGEFTPPVSKALPEGFPASVPTYPDGIVIQTIFQRDAQGDTYGLTILTLDGADGAIDFYRSAFEEQGWTVTDSDASGSGLEDAVAITFESDDGTVSGNIAAGTFAEDEDYTQIELQVQQLDDMEGD